MSYALTIGSLHLLADSAGPITEACDCHATRDLCTPSFVFSVDGQVGFRSALEHLAICRTNQCRGLRTSVLDGMEDKLRWLFNEQCLLGCVHIQPLLYGSRRVGLKRKEFPSIAHHLARCPKESCAQLRRSLLLTIRDQLRPQPT